MYGKVSVNWDGYSKGYKTDGILPVTQIEGIIKSDCNKDKIEQLHKLVKGCSLYDEIKSGLPFVKIHGVFKNGTADTNFVCPSGYIYLDIDNCDTEKIKHQLLEKHSDKIFMCGRSCGGRGLFILIKIANTSLLFSEYFDSIHEYFRCKVFCDFSIDHNSKGIGRNWVLPYDENVYSNPDAIYTIPKDYKIDYLISKKHIAQCVKDNKKKTINTVLYDYPAFDTFYDSIIWNTPYEVKDAIVDEVEHEYYKLRIFPIKDGMKHTRFPQIIFTLRKLNPHLSFVQVLSFMHWVNEKFTCSQPMLSYKLNSLVEYFFYQYDESKVVEKTKGVWFNKDCGLNKIEKCKVANSINGRKKSMKAKEVIKNTLRKFILNDYKITKAKVSKESGISIGTIHKYWEECTNDLGCP